MTNKYKELSKAKDVILDNRCRNKVQYGTKEEAYQKGQDSYHCGTCHKWHRTSIIKGTKKKMKGFSL